MTDQTTQGHRPLRLAHAVSRTAEGAAAVAALAVLPLVLVAIAAIEDRAVSAGRLREPGLWRELI